jgi:hypothetical protein
MLKFFFNYFNSCIYLILLITAFPINADNFKYNIYNNHGTIGLINTPTARFYDESVHGITVIDGTPDQKVTFTSSPFDWFEASFFYANVQGYAYPGYEYQDYKDKGFNAKIRLKKEGRLPAVAVGFYDFAGTGLYSSEYIVSSYGINNIDLHLGLGWGRLNQESDKYKNPLAYLDDKFENRPGLYAALGGQFETAKFFRGNVSPFYGVAYKASDKFVLKFERDPIAKENNSPIIYEKPSSRYSMGVDYLINDRFSLGASFERGNFFSLRFVYKNNPKKTLPKYEYKNPTPDDYDDYENRNKWGKLIRNLDKNDIGVNRITETSRSIGLELTQFIHPNLKVVEQIIEQAKVNAGIEKDIKTDLKVAGLTAISEIDEDLKKNAQTIYQRKELKNIVTTSTKIRFRPYIASREEFFKGAFLLTNNTEVVIRKNLFFHSNLKYNLVNNFDDLRYPPIDTGPAQVRSDNKQYLKGMVNSGVLIGRAQLDYHITPKSNHHLMFTGGILEDMFSGVGMEYLFFKPNTNYSFGIELFKVKKRDYEWKFGHLDYENTLANAKFYYRNYGSIPFDMKFSFGEYLAGDVGSTIEFSRTFDGGVKFGAWASFTDVSTEQFGEGSFDKGIFFKIPIYGGLFDYKWRPLTKDPAASLLRKHTLYDLLVRFRPID